MNEANEHIKFTHETSHEGKLAFLDCSVRVLSDGHLETTVYRKDTHTDQYLLFDSHHPLIHKLSVIRTLFYRADTIISNDCYKQEKYQHLKSALKTLSRFDFSQSAEAQKISLLITRLATKGTPTIHHFARISPSRMSLVSPRNCVES